MLTVKLQGVIYYVQLAFVR